MSDLFETREKVEKGAQWRGEITVSIDGEQHNLTIRQLRDTEFWEVMSLVDLDEIEDLQEQLPEDKMDTIEELQNKDDLTEEEQTKLENVKDEIEQEDVNMFDILSYDTFRGIQLAAKYGVEPDAEDCRTALGQYGDKITDRYGAATDEEARKWIQDEQIDPMIEDSTDFTSFTIGVKALTESIGDTGNSNN